MLKLCYTENMNPRRKINSNTLQYLYVENELTIQQIAVRFGCSETTIRRRLEEEGIPRRRPGPHLDRDIASAYPWSPELAYAVGLIATDGNLSKDGRHLTLTSADRELIETFQQCLGLDNRITQIGIFRRHFRIQWGDRVFYNWLLSIGLMPNKSRQLGVLKIPDDYLPDFVRGCLDGDGNIQTYTDRYNVFKNPKYVYERLMVRFVSASLPFLEWLQTNLERQLGVRGGTFKSKPRANRSEVWTLKYAKNDSLKVLRWLYYAPGVPCLRRKRDQVLSWLSQIV